MISDTSIADQVKIKELHKVFFLILHIQLNTWIDCNKCFDES